MTDEKPAYIGRARDALSRYMTEDELLTAVTEAATYLGWRWMHIRRTDLGLQMGHIGFPDLVLAKNGRVLFVELKTEIGALSPSQREWIAAIEGDSPMMPTVEALLVQPGTLDRMLRLLGARIL